MLSVFRALVLTGARLAAALFVAAGLMLTYEVAARYFFTRPTIWAAELSQMCLIWGSLLAMAWLLGARRHIQVDALIRLLPPAPRRLVDALAMLAVALFAGFAAWYGFEIFHDSFVRGRTTGSMLNIPLWLTELALPVGFALLLAQALLEIPRALRGRGDDEGVGSGGDGLVHEHERPPR